MAQVRLSERSGHGNIGGVAAGRHEDPADAGLVVAGIECPPAVVEVDFKPRAEIHGPTRRHADVAEVACRVAGGNVQRAAEGDGKMLKVAAHAHALGKDVQGGF